MRMHLHRLERVWRAAVRRAGWRPPTLVAVVALVVAILVVELGWRDPGPGMLVAVPTPGVLREPIERLRSVPLVRIGDPRAAAVASGVVFGRTDHVSPVDEQAFLDSGLWHLLAASGQNIALVAACCVLLARAVGAGRTTGAVLALAAIPLYVLVVGGGASIVRAGFMGELMLVAWLAGRMADVRHMLVVAAATICWIWPGAHRGLGMQLSFACVAVLIAWASPATAALRDRGVPTWLAGGLSATLLCSLATAPLLVLSTGGAPLTGIVANIVAVPIAACLLVLGLAGAFIALGATALGWGTVADLAMWPASLLSSTLVRIAERAANLPAAQTTSITLALSMPAIALAVVALRGPLSHRRRLRRRLVAVGLVVACLLSAMSLGAHRPGAGAAAAPSSDVLRIAVLDIGQGDATLLASDGHAILVDTGPPDGNVVRRVREAGVEHLDGIVLTHDSLDHRGGFEHALAALDPAWVAMPRSAPGPWRRVREAAPRLVELCAGGAFTVGRAHVDVLHPQCSGVIVPRTGDLHNDGAMVLLVSHGDVRALLPADAEAPVLVGLGLPRLDLLRVSHHGSEDPALPALLARTQPQVAAISAGEGNDYGHPRRQVLDALASAGVRTFRTDQDGSVVLDSDGRRLMRVG
ncbi:MAG: fold metallo-hydrolase [Thermoleophilia bacterium]|nr:fold metallo-hydrolase [Thermoleophilia bacterium]